MADKDAYGTTGISLDRAVRELKTYCEDAVNFLRSELEEDWTLAERYYNGETDLEEVDGRSNVVKTEVRDAIRNTMPSVMRVLLQARSPVEYIPSSVEHGEWVEQQSDYAAHLFWNNDGYKQLYTSVLEALKLKIGPMKATWEPDPLPTFVKYTKVPWSTVESLIQDPLFEVDDFEKVDTQVGNVELFDVEGYRVRENGNIVIEAIPNYEFFISRNMNSIEMAIDRGVHGQRGIISVSEAMEMGLDYDNWIELDQEDPEQSDHTTSSAERRGYNKDDVNDPSSVDVLQHKFLLTEVYVSYDLKGTQRPQLYRFFLGGSSYKYIHHEEVEDSPFAITTPIPVPHSVYGHSMADLTVNEQDTSTSLLRALVDNAHAANGVKIAADPSKTNFDDLMNPALNAPVRKRAGDTLQTIQIPFTGQGNLATLQYLDQDVQNKVGITKAAQGLDPDAMQSTDKQAVMNTIMTGQGQTELIVRNVVETCLIRLFKILLRLSVQHQEPTQIMRIKGKVVPVNTSMFDPDATARPAVGLGTASPMQKQAALNYVYQQQQMMMDKFGPNNPFTSFAQMYNTLEDLMEANSVHNVGRYFNIVTPEVEKQWARAQQEQQAKMAEQQQANQPMDPSKAFLQVEAQKSGLKQMEIVAEQQRKAKELELRAIESAERLDIERDKMIQDRSLKLVELQAKQENEAIKAEQASNERISTGTSKSGKKSA